MHTRNSVTGAAGRLACTWRDIGRIVAALRRRSSKHEDAAIYRTRKVQDPRERHLPFRPKRRERSPELDLAENSDVANISCIAPPRLSGYLDLGIAKADFRSDNLLPQDYLRKLLMVR